MSGEGLFYESNEIKINGVTFIRMGNTDYHGNRFLCKNCESIGLRTVLQYGEMLERNWYPYPNHVRLREMLVDHARDHNNHIVRQIEKTYAVEVVQHELIEVVDPVIALDQDIIVTKVLKLQPSKPKPKPRRMIQI